MKILAIDTSGPVASCAVMVDGRIVHTIAMNHGMTHSEAIMPAVDAALEASDLSCADIDVFAAVCGPGSYTGVRIGVCAAKGLAHASGKMCFAAHALEALAANFARFDGIICPILDARRGQVYCAAFDARSATLMRVLPDDACALEDFLTRLPRDERLMFAGDGIDVHAARIRDICGSAALFAPANLRDLRADAVCVLAMDDSRWVEPHAIRPLYLRAPQAERERSERMRRGDGQ